MYWKVWVQYSKQTTICQRWGVHDTPHSSYGGADPDYSSTVRLFVFVVISGILVAAQKYCQKQRNTFDLGCSKCAPHFDAT